MLLGMQIMNVYGSCHKIGELKPGQICFLANTMEIKHAFYPVEVGLLYHFFEFFFKSSIFVTSAAFEYDWNFTPALLVLLYFEKRAFHSKFCTNGIWIVWRIEM